LIELRAIEGLSGLTAAETEALGRALRDTRVAVATRAGLLDLIRRRQWREALAAVKGSTIDGPEVLEATLAARAALDDPPSPGEIQRHLASTDPAIRSAAIRALATAKQPDTALIARVATNDADVGVRVTAIDALGTTGKPSALPTLSQTLAASDRDLRQASARAILAIGGAPATEVLATTALRGADEQTRSYAAVLLLIVAGKDSPAVRRVIAANPPGEVREVLEHGLKWHHAHEHGD
jgi:HEAT repeat protein